MRDALYYNKPVDQVCLPVALLARCPPGSLAGQVRTVSGYGDAAESLSPLPTAEVSEDLRLAVWKVSVR